MDMQAARAEMGNFVGYILDYREGATQLTQQGIAGRWHKLGHPVETAIAWANHGYLPEEAQPLIEAGMTPELASAADPQTEAEMYEYLATQIDLLNQDRD